MVALLFYYNLWVLSGILSFGFLILGCALVLKHSPYVHKAFLWLSSTTLFLRALGFLADPSIPLLGP